MTVCASVSLSDAESLCGSVAFCAQDQSVLIKTAKQGKKWRGRSTDSSIKVCADLPCNYCE